MRDTKSRRLTLGVLALALLSLTACGNATSDDATPGDRTPGDREPADPAADFRALERKFDARLGVYALNTATGREVRHHADERFAYASTFKSLVAGVLLRHHTEKELEKVLRYDEEELVAHSPVTEKHVETGMSLSELAAAAVRVSDNTAVNLLLEELGGPKAVGAFLKKELGDDVTRMSRYEPDLNEATPGDTRDTSTPRALAANLEAFVLGDMLTTADRAQLTTWLRTNETGSTLIQAGVPDSWTVADKSGAGGYGTRNDIGVVWPGDPDDTEPIVVAIMSRKKEEDADYVDALVAEAATVATESLAPTATNQP